VVIELGIRRGTTSLTILKAENRQPESLHKPLVYWSQGLEVRFDPQKRGAGVLELGSKIKKMRLQRGVSQADLARLVGVTASNISQVESNQIYPSLPALTKIAEVLEVEVSHFFQDQGPKTRQLVFPLSQGTILKPAESSSDGLQIRLLLPEEASAKTRPHLIEFPPGHQLSSHFFQYKGEEIGYLLQGNLEVTIDNELKFLNPGDTIYLTSEMPCAWRNPTDEPAKLLWFTLASI
jgi:transcriptional regulator with XRE-family HTH domain